MKKKFLVLFLTVLCFIMVGCGKATKSVNNEESKKSDTVEKTVVPSKPATTAENTSSKSASVKLSDDIYSFQMEFNGDLYQFPMSYDEFIALGWQFNGDASQKLDPEQYTIEGFKKGDISISVKLFNLGNDVESLDKCSVGGVDIDEFSLNDQKVTFSLPKGIQFGVSTYEDIVAAYGDPTRTNKGELTTTLTYEYSSYQDIEIQVDAKTKVISAIEISNLVEPKDNTKDTTTNASSETPEIVKQYKAPTSLGDDLQTFIVKYDGALYKMPAPVSEFEKNGWKIISEESDQSVKAKDFGWVTLMKNNQKLNVTAVNYADSITTINNCFVTTVKGDDNSTDIPITVQKNITRGMTQKDLDKALKGIKYSKDDSASLIFYTIEGKDSSTDYVQVIVSKDTSKVQTIEVQYQPKKEKLFQ